MFSCKPGDNTPKTTQFSTLIKDEFKRQLDVYGYVKTFDSRAVLSKFSKMETKDNTRFPLYWVVKGTTPIPGKEHKIISLKQQLLLLKLGITIDYDRIRLSERVVATGDWNAAKTLKFPTDA